MKLIEVLKNENKGLFNRYMELYPDDLIKIYDDVSSEFIQYLDIVFSGVYGQKSFSPIVENYYLHNYDSVIDFVCYLVHFNCLHKMESIKNVYGTKYDFTEEQKEIITDKTITKGNTSNNSIMENIENTYGYDSENAVKDNSTNNTDNSETTQNIEVTKEYTKKINSTPLSKLLDSEIDRKSREDFILLTFKAIENILFIDIYN